MSMIPRITPLLALLALAGCQSARVADPLTAKLAGADEDSQMEFWHTLSERKIVSNDEAFHALLLLFEGKDEAADYPGRVAAMKSKGMLADRFDEPADLAVRRGCLALALGRGAKVKGGVILRGLDALGIQSERYSLRELQYQNVLAAGSENMTFSGAEFIGIIARIEDFQKASQSARAAAN